MQPIPEVRKLLRTNLKPEVAKLLKLLSSQIRKVLKARKKFLLK